MYINIFSLDGPKFSFQKENYIKEIEEMQNISRLELVASLRRSLFITSYSCLPVRHYICAYKYLV
jgi:hypothetical protein